MMANYGEPWVNDGCSDVDNAAGVNLAQFWADNDCDRAVACVNACAGLNPDAVPELVKACEGAVGVLEMVLSDGGSCDIEEAREAAGECNDALAKLKDQAP